MVVVVQSVFAFVVENHYVEKAKNIPVQYVEANGEERRTLNHRNDKIIEREGQQMKKKDGCMCHH